MPVPADEPIIAEVNDTGVILSDGVVLSFTDLSRIMAELSPASVRPKWLKSVSGNGEHITSTFKEAARILPYFAKV